MLEFLVDNIFVVFGGKVFQQIVGIPMGTNCAPLLADIFLYSYEAEFIQSLLSTGKKNIDVCKTLMPPFPNMTFDLDLLPTDLKINRDHLLIKDYLPTKFEASRAKPS